MNSGDLYRLKDLFARIFVLAVSNKMHLTAFTRALEKSTFLLKVEKGLYDDYFNQSIENIFFDITDYHIREDDAFGVYDDAYWSGAAYFELNLRLNRPFSYLFRKLPLEEMMNIYSIYHEMDITSLVGRFQEAEREKTILRILCEERGCSLPALSKATGIGLPILRKYNASDDALFKGSFQNIVRIAEFFDAPLSLFVNKGH